MDKKTGCIPCAKAHLLGVMGSLEEALRFAREDGIEHEEVQNRIDNAAKELIMLERYDLTPDKIENLEEEKRELINEILTDIREVRQNILNRIDSLEDLENEASNVSEIYYYLRNNS